MRDFLVGLCIIALTVLTCMAVGYALSGLIALDSKDDNLFVKTILGFFSLLGGFIFIMLCTSIGALFERKK